MKNKWLTIIGGVIAAVCLILVGYLSNERAMAQSSQEEISSSKSSVLLSEQSDKDNNSAIVPDYTKLSLLMDDYIDGEDVLGKSVKVHIRDITFSKVDIGAPYYCDFGQNYTPVLKKIQAGDTIIIRVDKITNFEGVCIQATYLGSL
nr:hypothetical protein [uncultured Butyrivibrio sp.]